MPTKDPFPNRANVLTHAAGQSNSTGEYRDLCSNCDNGDACCGRTRPTRPIFFCEEFVVFGAEPAPEPDRSAEEKPRRHGAPNGYIGLCVNCDNARTCVMPKPEAGSGTVRSIDRMIQEAVTASQGSPPDPNAVDRQDILRIMAATAGTGAG